MGRDDSRSNTRNDIYILSNDKIKADAICTVVMIGTLVI